MCEESVKGKSITCGQVILVLLIEELVHCVHPSPSLGVLQLERRALDREVKARWAGYFERLYQADPTAVELDVRGVTIPIAKPPINCEPPSFVETQAVLSKLKGGNVPGICSIHAELLKAGGNAVLVLLHAVLCSVWSTGIIQTD